jgi:hypothetical protein
MMAPSIASLRRNETSVVVVARVSYSTRAMEPNAMFSFLTGVGFEFEGGTDVQYTGRVD